MDGTIRTSNRTVLFVSFHFTEGKKKCVSKIVHCLRKQCLSTFNCRNEIVSRFILQRCFLSFGWRICGFDNSTFVFIAGKTFRSIRAVHREKEKKKEIPKFKRRRRKCQVKFANVIGIRYVQKQRKQNCLMTLNLGKCVVNGINVKQN